jgi:hypothetical protein
MDQSEIFAVVRQQVGNKEGRCVVFLPTLDLAVKMAKRNIRNGMDVIAIFNPWKSGGSYTEGQGLEYLENSHD